MAKSDLKGSTKDYSMFSKGSEFKKNSIFWIIYLQFPVAMRCKQKTHFMILCVAKWMLSVKLEKSMCGKRHFRLNDGTPLPTKILPRLKSFDIIFDNILVLHKISSIKRSIYFKNHVKYLKIVIPIFQTKGNTKRIKTQLHFKNFFIW